MKKYDRPILEEEKVEIEDIVASSLGVSEKGEEVSFWGSWFQ